MEDGFEEDDGGNGTRRSSRPALLLLVLLVLLGVGGVGVETAAAAALSSSSPPTPLRSRIHSANSSSASVPQSPPNLSEPSSWSTLLPARAAALFGERECVSGEERNKK